MTGETGGQWRIRSSLRADQPAFREDTCCEGGQEVSGGSSPHWEPTSRRSERRRAVRGGQVSGGSSPH